MRNLFEFDIDPSSMQEQVCEHFDDSIAGAKEFFEMMRSSFEKRFSCNFIDTIKYKYDLHDDRDVMSIISGESPYSPKPIPRGPARKVEICLTGPELMRKIMSNPEKKS